MAEEVTDVWCWWEGAASPSVELCLENWKRVLCPRTYRIRVVNRSNVASLLGGCAVPCACDDTPLRALQSDFVRLALLSRYGGVWLDASVILNESLDWLRDAACREGAHFQAFFNPRNMTRDHRFPVIETSVLYSRRPRHPLVEDWLAKIQSLQSCDDDGRNEWLRRVVDAGGVDIQSNVGREYHLVYHALQAVLQEDERGIERYAGVRLHDSVARNVNSVLQSNRPYYTSAYEAGPLLKLIKEDREDLDERLRSGGVPRGSFVARALALGDAQCGDPVTDIPVYVIHLKRHAERLVHMQSLVRRLGFANVTFVEPVALREVEPYAPGADQAPKMSHSWTYLNVLREAGARHERFFVLEDDIDTDATGADAVCRMQAGLDCVRRGECDLFYFEYCFEACEEAEPLQSTPYRMVEPLCAGCILHSARSAKAIIGHCTMHGILKDIHFDNVLKGLIRQGALRALGRSLFQQSSTFESSLPGSWRATSWGRHQKDPLCVQRSDGWWWWPSYGKVHQLAQLEQARRDLG